ncbi:MAG: hypothetical protein ACOYI2_03095 [Bacillota bacterium]|nr:hypothetical protein [Clostridia bacterium]
MREKGSVALFAVFGLLVLMLLGVALLEISNIELQMSLSMLDRVKAYYLAEAGMEKALAKIKFDPAFLHNLTVGSIVIQGEDPFNGEIDLACDCSFTHVVLTAKEQNDETIISTFSVTGRCNSAVCNLKARVKTHPDGLIDILYWKT